MRMEIVVGDVEVVGVVDIISYSSIQSLLNQKNNRGPSNKRQFPVAIIIREPQGKYLDPIFYFVLALLFWHSKMGPMNGIFPGNTL